MRKLFHNKRMGRWKKYFELLASELSKIGVGIPTNPTDTDHNGHIFYIVTRSLEERNNLIDYLKRNSVDAVFHYLPLHSSPFYKEHHDGRELPNCDIFSQRLMRLPLWPDLSLEDVEYICMNVLSFYKVR
jgi:dTDP-4-amino-4,6-dideoxygalactose transaminase